MISSEVYDKFGLRLIGISEDSIGFKGFISECLSLGLALGMEVKELKGASRETKDGIFYSENGTEDNFSYCEFKQGAFIIRLDNPNHGFIGIPMFVWLSQDNTKDLQD